MKDFSTFFSALGIRHGVRFHPTDPRSSLYRRVLGSAWLDLPASVLHMHGDTQTRRWLGRASVTRGSNLLANFIADLFSFPKASSDVGVTVEFRRHNGREKWIRNFSGRRFSSVQYEGRGRYEGLLCERFGPFTFGLGLVVDNGRLLVPIRKWDFLGIPLPLWLGPRNRTSEFDEDGAFRFHIDVSLPLIGQVIKYEGYFDHELPVPGSDAVSSYGLRARYRNGRLTSMR